MDLSERIKAFGKLGEYLKQNLQDVKDPGFTTTAGGEELFLNSELRGISEKAREVNPWFISLFVHYALAQTSRILSIENLEQWTGMYDPAGLHPDECRVVGTILAGNIPLVGFHDFLSILISGNGFSRSRVRFARPCGTVSPLVTITTDGACFSNTAR